MFENFTVVAKRAVKAAEQEATALGHDFIGTEHILLGLAGIEDGVAAEVLSEHGVTSSRASAETVRILEAAGYQGTGGQEAKEALAALGIDVTEIQRRADESFGPGRFRFPRPAFTPRGRKVLELSTEEARQLKHDEVGTGHLLLALLTEGEGVAIKVLEALGVDVTALRPAVLARIEA